MTKKIPLLKIARFPQVLGVVACLVGSLQANQLNPAAETGAGVLPVLPEGSGADGRSQAETVDQAAIDKMVRDLAAANGKPKLAVMDALITIDGVPRPDLGASFSNSLTAKLLKEGAYDVIDSSALGASSTPTATAFDFGKSTGADFVVVPTVVGIQGEFRLSMRKLRLPGGRIDKIVQETVRGDQRLIFALAEKSATQLAPEPDPNAPPKKYEPPFTYVRAWMAPPVKVDPMVAAVKKAPKALKGNGSLSGAIVQNKVAQENGQDRHPQRLGAIQLVDNQWCFCELSLPVGTVKLKDQLFAWGGSSQDATIPLNVSRIDGTRVIAEFDASDSRKSGLHTGLAVYQWKTTPLK